MVHQDRHEGAESGKTGRELAAICGLRTHGVTRNVGWDIAKCVCVVETAGVSVTSGPVGPRRPLAKSQ